MNIAHLYHPNHREEVSVTVNEMEHYDLTYNEWCGLMETVEDGHVSYATWYQEEETNNELMVLVHEYTIERGEVKSYNNYLTD